MPTEAQALAELRAAILRGDLAGAERVANAGLREHPQSLELRRALAGIVRQGGRDAEAETWLRDVLATDPRDVPSAFTLAEIHIQHGRLGAAARVLRTCFEGGTHEANLSIRAIEMLADAQRQADAAVIAEVALATHPDDARLHAYAGMLHVQTGQFALAREHYLFALAHDARACEWNVPHGLAGAQRYTDAAHPDFALFGGCLARADLSDKARASLLFAIAKAHDDVGQQAQAADFLRQGNALAQAASNWSRKNWKRAVESRLSRKPLAHRIEPPDFVPVFIVGMPRSGTTLLADLLGRYPRVCNRGELPWLARLAAHPALAGNPAPAALRSAAATYAAQWRQDDFGDAHWFIDKQPLNFRYVDLMLALYPNARILVCRRDPRDTALSLWSQLFMEDVQGYAYAFDDIALVMRDAERLLAHWAEHFAASMREVRYEDMATRPEHVVDGVARWLGFPADARPAVQSPDHAIATASLWQVRQPVYTRSIGRWRAYAPFVPELAKLASG